MQDRESDHCNGRPRRPHHVLEGSDSLTVLVNAGVDPRIELPPQLNHQMCGSWAVDQSLCRGIAKSPLLLTDTEFTDIQVCPNHKFLQQLHQRHRVLAIVRLK
jgi:hypothetical protein